MHPLASAVTELGAFLRSRELRPNPEVRSTARWSAERANRWAAETGWLLGCNFIPSTAGNQLEMFQAETFDPETIDRELGWAASIGMNSVRIFLHDLLWTNDGDAFLDRFDEVLAIADGHGISVMPVLFDGIWDPHPRWGPQREPKPGVHNSIWLQSPGAEILADPSRWPALRGYVDAVLGRFGHDPRVVLWDLFNEPDSPNPNYVRGDPPHKLALIEGLLNQVFDWAQAADPDQPITAGVYLHVRRACERARPSARISLARSDIITFHAYVPDKALLAIIGRLRRLGRPLVCTEWMARPRSPVAQLQVFADQGVGAFNWGLVDGRTQTRFPWTGWQFLTGPIRAWFHELFHADGTPYDEAEVATFRRLSAEHHAR